MSTQLTPFLVLDGKAGEAVHYYQQVLGAAGFYPKHL